MFSQQKTHSNYAMQRRYGFSRPLLAAIFYHLLFTEPLFASYV